MSDDQKTTETLSQVNTDKANQAEQSAKVTSGDSQITKSGDITVTSDGYILNQMSPDDEFMRSDYHRSDEPQVLEGIQINNESYTQATKINVFKQDYVVLIRKK